jgi:VIT1/CCC1 family predicted Fe2+/Mn2+ transporter
VGVGVVTARNLIERKPEFEILEKLGISKSLRESIVKQEVRSMIIWGLGLGFAASLIAIIPVVGGTIGALDLVWMVALVILIALIANFIGTRALR